MELTYLNNELNVTKEHELFSDNENGFKVTVTYKKDSWISKNEFKEVVEVFNNCTEVHYMYESIVPRNDKRIAFESNIHRTGLTRSVDDIKSIVIENATSIEDDF